jgi:hypothetical protein
MDLNLQDLRRYAIDNRALITFRDSATGSRCVINTRGQVKIADENKQLRVEEALAAASNFEVTGPGKPQQLSREALAALIGESINRRGVAAVKEEE